MYRFYSPVDGFDTDEKSWVIIRNRRETRLGDQGWVLGVALAGEAGLERMQASTEQ